MPSTSDRGKPWWFMPGNGDRDTGATTSASSRNDPAAGPVAVGVTIAIGTVATALVVAAYRDAPSTAIALCVVLVVSVWLSAIDVREHRLPNRIVGPLAAAVAIGVIVAGLADDDLARSWRSLAFGVGVALVLLIANIVGGLGMGDVKYGFPMAATVGWFGWDAVSVAIMVTSLSGAVAAVAVLAIDRTLKRQLPYGPFMALGLAAGLLFAAP